MIVCEREEAPQRESATFFTECERCHVEMMVVRDNLVRTIGYVTDPGFRIVRVTISSAGVDGADPFYYCDCAPACEKCRRATPHLERGLCHNCRLEEHGAGIQKP